MRLLTTVEPKPNKSVCESARERERQRSSERETERERERERERASERASERERARAREREIESARVLTTVEPKPNKLPRNGSTSARRTTGPNRSTNPIHISPTPRMRNSHTLAACSDAAPDATCSSVRDPTSMRDMLRASTCVVHERQCLIYYPTVPDLPHT